MAFGISPDTLALKPSDVLNQLIQNRQIKAEYDRMELQRELARQQEQEAKQRQRESIAAQRELAQMSESGAMGRLDKQLAAQAAETKPWAPGTKEEYGWAHGVGEPKEVATKEQIMRKWALGQPITDDEKKVIGIFETSADKIANQILQNMTPQQTPPTETPPLSQYTKPPPVEQTEPISPIAPETPVTTPTLQPIPAPTFGGGWQLETFNVGGIGLKKQPTETEKQQALTDKQTELVTGEITKAQGKRLEEASFGDVAFGQVVSMMRQMVGQLKGKQEEQGGLGRMPGIKGKVMGGGLRKPEYARTQAFEGQRVETALRLNRIVTGQNRVIRSVINMLYMTLPDSFDSEPTSAQKIDQSVKNAYRLIKTYEKLGYTPDKLSKMPSYKMKIGGKEIEVIDIPDLSESGIQSFTMTPQEETIINTIIDSILAEPSVKPKTFGGNARKFGQSSNSNDPFGIR